jgi:hypothetical protein
MEISESGGKPVGTYSDPAIPNGVFNLRMTFSLSDITMEEVHCGADHRAAPRG